MRNMTNSFIYGYINLLNYKKCSVLDVSATFKAVFFEGYITQTA